MRPVAHNPSRRPRRAFTLIELLVVITVIAILAGMLLPAIRWARESTRRKSSTQLVTQVAMALAQYTDTFGEPPPERTPAPRLYSSECLAVFLGGQGSLPDDLPSAPASRSFLSLRRTLVTDTDDNGHAEIVDAWAMPILYSRPQFTGAGAASWSIADTALSGGRPLHNPKTFDVFSANTYGRHILGDPAEVGLDDFEDEGLKKRSSYGSEHSYRYPYLHEYVKDRSKTNNHENAYIGNW